jgi:putative surface-exposed virulence protein
MKHSMRLLLTLFMVLTMALSAVTPVFAEDPPPPPPVESPDGNGGTQDKADSTTTETATSSTYSNELPVDPTAGQDAGTTEDFTQMPNYSPGGAANSGMGTFQGEELINTSGNPVDPGTDLAALLDPYAMACPPGAVPFWYTGGTCFNIEYSLLKDAIDVALPGWTVWMQDYFWDGADHVHINKPLTLQGSPLGSAFIGDTAGGFWDSIYVESGNVTIRDVLAEGWIYVNPGYTGTLRLQDVYINSPNYYGFWVSYGYSGNVILSQVYTDSNLYGSSVNLLAGTGTATVVNSVFDRTHLDEGLSIYANNTVKLENVTASNNWGNGAYIEYAKGLSVKNSMFNYNNDGVINGNHGFGLEAYDIGTMSGFARGPVLLQNVYAQYNDEDGLHLAQTGALTVQNASLIGNAGHGMMVDGYSTATLDGVTARNNAFMYGFGTYLWLQGATTITNSAFESNYYDGLYLITSGAVTLKGVKAAFNWGDGADIETNTGAVSVQGGYYDSNDYNGLSVDTRGNITLNGIVATWNNGSGGGTASVDLDNCQWNGSSCLGSGSVTITNTLGQNVIANNSLSGLLINSRGTVNLNTLNVRDNMHNGITINNCHWNGVSAQCMGVGNVSLTNINVSQNGYNWVSGAVHSSAYGIDVYSNGTITLDKVTAERNTFFGIYLDSSESTSPKTITMKNIYVLDNNGAGATAFANGAISVNHIISINNASAGLITGTWGGVTITNTLGANIVDNNSAGVQINSGGAVNVNGLSASYNWSSEGIMIDNTWGLGSVTITNSRFNGNNDYGMGIDSQGNISLSNVQADDNSTGYGAWLYNPYIAGKTITVNKSSFNNNYSYGLYIDAAGNVTLNGVSASNNDNVGLWLRNDYHNLSAAYNVSILSTLGVNMFNNNAIPSNNNNVYIQTSGNVTISKATANNRYDGDNGFVIYHTGNWSGKKITFICTTADQNWDYGFYIVNVGGLPVNVYLNGSGTTGNWGNYASIGAVNWFFTRTNCP